VTSIERLSRIQLVCSEPARIARFYQAALGFLRRADADAIHTIPGNIELNLGGEIIELVKMPPGGFAYPVDVCGANLIFQHFAILVRDMASAYTHLSAHQGWTPLSTDGPQQLPASSGGVTAFKFRDPDGHPLELLAFPSGRTPGHRARSTSEFQGIDHTALSVADTARSIAFYRGLGLLVKDGSINVGREQDRLDGMSEVHLTVTSLVPALRPSPHVELLSYANAASGEPPAAIDDIASTRMVLAVTTAADLQSLCHQNAGSLVRPPESRGGDAFRAMLRDPDGHLILLEVPRNGSHAAPSTKESSRSS
jgi:catechol 2,3-dioxygenase-like lactoylglutathione lyase family enzyme